MCGSHISGHLVTISLVYDIEMPNLFGGEQETKKIYIAGRQAQKHDVAVRQCGTK